MKAVGYRSPGPLDRHDALIDFEMATPVPTGHDLLVRVQAVSVNPVDYKIRMGRPAEGDTPAVLGWDAVGEVVAIGDRASAFRPGDVVWYARNVVGIILYYRHQLSRSLRQIKVMRIKT